IGNKRVDQDLFIYTRPYFEQHDLYMSYLLQSIDSVGRKYVSGESSNDYWETYPKLSPDTSVFNLHKNFTKELKGLWQMHISFMGGPYVSNTFVSKDNKQLITIVGFVYAPQLKKREYLREVQAISHTV